jgi:acylglycerol lipase
MPLPVEKEAFSPQRTPEIQRIRATDGVELACRIWRGQPEKPVLVYLHGIEGHSQWFEETAAILAQHGFTVYAPDRRGAGLNAQDRGHMRKHQQVLADVELILRQAATENSGSSLFLFGNCWGAKVAAVMAAQNYKPITGPLNFAISGLILTCPALFTKVDLNFKSKALLAFDVLRGGTYQMRQIDIPIQIEMFTDNPKFLEFIKQDPLRLKAATSRFYFENFLLSLKASAAASKIQLPVLLIQTDRDEIVNFAQVDAWFARVSSQRKQMRIFGNASHSIDFDARYLTQYVALLEDWLNEMAVPA